MWEAVYIIEGLLKNASDIQPDTIHADRQGQSLPVFGLAALLGFDLLPRIRNSHDLVSLFGDELVDWDLIKAHWSDLLRTAISIRENRMSSVTLLQAAIRRPHGCSPGGCPWWTCRRASYVTSRRRPRPGAGSCWPPTRSYPR